MFETWLFALHIVDIFCCFVVMIPILWSLSHLREASSTDGKKRESAEKLKLFQEVRRNGRIYRKREEKRREENKGRRKRKVS